MSTLFIIYTSLCIITIAVLFVLGYFTFLNKKILKKDWFFIFVGLALFETFSLAITKGIETNNKLIVEFKVPKVFYSSYNIEEDTILTDDVLYRYLLDIRVPHAKIILCQAKIESANYKSPLFKSNNNLFGMKIPTQRANVGSPGRAGYQSYVRWEDSATDMLIFILSHGLDKLSDKEYLKYLQKFYAEDPNYVNKISKKLKEINVEKI